MIQYNNLFCERTLAYVVTFPNYGAALVAFSISCFGWYMAYRVRRTNMFRAKLAFVYLTPTLFAITHICPIFMVSYTYNLLLIFFFVGQLIILYWRELGREKTQKGYHKMSLLSFLDDAPDLIWMKDLAGRFTYTNKAVREKVLLCTEDEAFGHTMREIVDKLKASGINHNFASQCADTDQTILKTEQPGRFLEFGCVGNRFLATQVYKAPLYKTFQDGRKKIIGIIGMGRDLTYDYMDHEKITKLIEADKLQEALESFEEHKTRYKLTGPRGQVKEEHYECP